MTAHILRLIADDGGARKQAKLAGPAVLVYALSAGLLALGLGAVASFAVSSEQGKLVIWSVVTGITAIAAGAMHESRRVRYWSRSVARWFQTAQRL